MSEPRQTIDLMAALIRSIHGERLEAGDVGGAHYLHSKECRSGCDYDCNPRGFEQADKWWPERRAADNERSEP